ncbi:MAG: hypothetical protein M1837_003921 [Sclerophora amabilis]|nr:MAG: hypothetical protein M1837_003921 [Sclerophora amabilis]
MKHWTWRILVALGRSSLPNLECRRHSNGSTAIFIPVSLSVVLPSPSTVLQNDNETGAIISTRQQPSLDQTAELRDARGDADRATESSAHPQLELEPHLLPDPTNWKRQIPKDPPQGLSIVLGFTEVNGLVSGSQGQLIQSQLSAWYNNMREDLYAVDGRVRTSRIFPQTYYDKIMSISLGLANLNVDQSVYIDGNILRAMLDIARRGPVEIDGFQGSRKISRFNNHKHYVLKAVDSAEHVWAELRITRISGDTQTERSVNRPPNRIRLFEQLEAYENPNN